MKSLSRVRLIATAWTAAHQAPPSMGFSRQEYWSGVPLPSPGLNLGLPHYRRILHHPSQILWEVRTRTEFCLNPRSARQGLWPVHVGPDPGQGSGGVALGTDVARAAFISRRRHPSSQPPISTLSPKSRGVFASSLSCLVRQRLLQPQSGGIPTRHRAAVVLTECVSVPALHPWRLMRPSLHSGQGVVKLDVQPKCLAVGPGGYTVVVCIGQVRLPPVGLTRRSGLTLHSVWSPRPSTAILPLFTESSAACAEGLPRVH